MDRIELHLIRRDVLLWALGGLEEKPEPEDPFIAAVRRSLGSDGKAPWGCFIELARAFGLRSNTARVRIHFARRNGLLPMKIDKNIPIPRKNTRPHKYGWSREMDRLAVGDSFFEAAATPETAVLIRASMVARAKTLGFKVTTRILTENETLGARCWRLA